ncbi:MAG: rhodanese-like domain-containing protein [Acidimicrobiales bacterium]
MPATVDRDEVLRLREQGAQLAEVLPRDEYSEEHLPGAIHLPHSTGAQQGRSIRGGPSSSTAGTRCET